MSAAVKICGVCSPEDAALVAELGADFIGVILAPGRARSRTVEEAALIYAAATGLRRVGVFVDAMADEVLRVAERLQLDVVQLHGAETAEQALVCQHEGHVVWKAVPVRGAADVKVALGVYEGSADALLLDGASAAASGGTGTAFRWTDVGPVLDGWPSSLRLVVAGGLHADNVLAAIGALRPDVVDVSSGVEAAPGVKSEQRLRRFITAARTGAVERLAE
jgi:phosphoribosylanthranilate isomerase